MGQRQSRAEIAAVILSKIADGQLPGIEITRVWAGPGSGRPCDGCDQPVTAADVEHEIDLADAVTLRLHSGCFLIWQDALEKRKISGGSGRVWTPSYAARVVAHEALLTTCAEVRATATQMRAVSRSVRAQRHLSPAA